MDTSRTSLETRLVSATTCQRGTAQSCPGAEPPRARAHSLAPRVISPASSEVSGGGAPLGGAAGGDRNGYNVEAEAGAGRTSQVAACPGLAGRLSLPLRFPATAALAQEILQDPSYKDHKILIMLSFL